LLALLHAWVLFPVALGLAGYGLGLLAEEASGRRLPWELLVPTGLAGVIVIGGIVTSWSATADLAVWVVGILAVIGLVRHTAWRRRVDGWALLAAVAVLLAYGAPVLLSGQATFNGVIKLDDTATWLGFTDQVMSHAREVANLPKSTYALVLQTNIGTGYPLGSFVPLGVGRALVDMDAAWVFQPYLAFCGAMVALCGYALLAPAIASPRLRALAAFIAAQSALLYGYSLWGGIKEVTLAFLLVLTVATAVDVFPRWEGRAREVVPLALAAGAVMDAFGPGGAVYVLPPLALVAVVWLWRTRAAHVLCRGLIRVGSLAGLTLACSLPILLILSEALSYETPFTGTHSGREEELGNLVAPLSGWQLGGIWPVHDFRYRPSTVPTVVLLLVVGIAAAGALVWSFRRRRGGVALYVGVALFTCGAGYLYGVTPWVIGKSLAISSPAVPLAAVMGGALLWSRSRLAGAVVLAVLAGGVLWSNVLSYHDATLAPRARLTELQTIGSLVTGKGPTFVNEYEIYADRHFLRSGAPVEPAEYRPLTLPLSDGTVLTKAAWADLDSFALSTLEPFRSIVTRRSPGESRPPSIYQLIWQGHYYELWQRPAQPPTKILEHVPLGESTRLPYCGVAQVGASKPLCSVNPVAIPPCSEIQNLARRALRENAQLVAYQRSEPIVARGDQTVWPAAWGHATDEHVLAATQPGQAVTHIGVPSGERYEVWLSGTSARGFDVSVDGGHLGRVKDQLSLFGQTNYVHVADHFLEPGVHRFVLTYPHADLTPGSGENEFTSLAAIALEPQSPASELIPVAPQQAARLCGRPLDWIELVTVA
jgi:hypothetical protein